MKHLLLLLSLLGLAACSPRGLHTTSQADHLRLGYLPNMTHAVPIIGLERSDFRRVEGLHFVVGNYLLNALITKNIDIGYIGPGPLIGALSKGIDLVILSASSDGANSFILNKPGLSPRQTLKDVRMIAVPQIANTQDLIAKLIFMGNHGYSRREASFDYIPVNPAELETAFFTGSIDSALVSEPWGSLLEEKGFLNAAHIKGFLSEEDIRILEDFPAALLVVERGFYEQNKALVDNFVLEQNRILTELETNPSQEHLRLIETHLERILKKDLGHKALEVSFFTKVKFRSQLNIPALEKLVEISKQAKYIRNDVDLKKHIAGAI